MRLSHPLIVALHPLAPRVGKTALGKMPPRTIVTKVTVYNVVRVRVRVCVHMCVHVCCSQSLAQPTTTLLS